MGKAVIVSDVGSFREYPDEICLKAPVDAGEEDHLFEYLNLLVSRPGDRAGAGRAGPPVGGTRMQLEFSRQSATRVFSKEKHGRKQNRLSRQRPSKCRSSTSPSGLLQRTDRANISRRIRRALKKRWRSRRRERNRIAILEMGAYLQITPALHSKLGYGEVRGCYFGPAGETKQRTVTSENGRDIYLRNKPF